MPLQSKWLITTRVKVRFEQQYVLRLITALVMNAWQSIKLKLKI